MAGEGAQHSEKERPRNPVGSFTGPWTGGQAASFSPYFPRLWESRHGAGPQGLAGAVAWRSQAVVGLRGPSLCVAQFTFGKCGHPHFSTPPTSSQGTASPSEACPVSGLHSVWRK